MTGEQIFRRYIDRSRRNELSTEEKRYFQDLMTASVTVDKQTFLTALEEAERTGQRIDLTYPIPLSEGPSTPNGIRLVKAA